MSQQAEQRSPPLVIACENQSQFQELKLAINSSTSLPVECLSSVPKLLKAHTIYFIELKLIESLFSEIFFKSVSLQFLTKANFNFKILNQINELQILFDESLSKEASEFERLSSIECSDMTPATSFTSLSSEFFTKIRQKAS